MNTPIQKKAPKLLIIGHARHGKDTVAEMISKLMGLSFVSSSEFVGRKCIWPSWGMERYCSFDDMFEDRVNYRSTWANLILAYNTPIRSRTASEMLDYHDMYVGMRNSEELNACINEDLFDYIIWVDASTRHSLEGKDSMQLTATDADLHIDNNGPEANLVEPISNLQKMLHEKGYAVQMPEPKEEKPPMEMYTLEDRPMVVNPTDAESRKFHNDALMATCPEKEMEEFRDMVLNHEVNTLIPGVYGPNDTIGGDPKSWEDAPEGAKTVLDHGFFRVLEVMGSDETIAESARMSYGRGTKKVSTTAGLINYLVRNRHTSPLEMGEIRFHIRMPIFVMRQWVRHRTANLNEYSGRYSEMVRLFYAPDPARIRHQDTVNKQGSTEPLEIGDAKVARNMMVIVSDQSFDTYERLLKMGVSRETARIVLPLNTYTEVVWKLDVSNLIKFLSLRDHDHSQWEIQQYAKLVAEAVKHHFPLVYAAYEEARKSYSLTEDEIYALMTCNYDDLSASQAKKIAELRDFIL